MSVNSIISYSDGRFILAHIQNGIRFHILRYDLSSNLFVNDINFNKSKGNYL